MPTFNVTVPLTPSYEHAFQEYLVINQTLVNISIDVHEGTHTYISLFQKVGSIKYHHLPQLEAAIRFTYSYYPAEDTIELYGNDFVSPSETTCLLTRPAGSNHVCQHLTCQSNSSYCDSTISQIYTSAYAPGLIGALNTSIRDSNERIILAAKNYFRIVRVKTPPPVLETVEETHKWMTMHAQDGTYLGAFDPNKVYPEGTIMLNQLESTWGGTVKFKTGEYIANVIGSSSDPKIDSKPWIEIWERQFGLESRCTSHNWASGNKFACNDDVQLNIIGGHVITGTAAKAMPNGSDSVYIMPICKAHNNNDNVYMRAQDYTDGIWLKNYLQ